jgi:hypothetical protein
VERRAFLTSVSVSMPGVRSKSSVKEDNIAQPSARSDVGGFAMPPADMNS